MQARFSILKERDDILLAWLFKRPHMAIVYLCNCVYLAFTCTQNFPWANFFIQKLKNVFSENRLSNSVEYSTSVSLTKKDKKVDKNEK